MHFTHEIGLGKVLLVEKQLEKGRLVLRSAQLRAFDREKRRQLPRFILTDLRQHHADVVPDVGEKILLDRIRHGIRRAVAHGLTRSADLALFVETQFLVAPNFDKYPPIQFLLNRPHLSPEERWRRVIETTTSRQWEGARRRYDPQAWNQGPKSRLV